MNFEDLLSMPLDESEALLEDFMTSDQNLLKAPDYLKNEITTKCYLAFICVKRIQLFTYSVKVCAAVAFSLILLFSISPTEFTHPYDYVKLEWKESYMQDSIEQDKKDSASWISDIKDSLLNNGFLNAEKSQEALIKDQDEMIQEAFEEIDEDIDYEENDCKSVKSKIQLLMEKIQKWLHTRKCTKNKTNNPY